MTEKYTEGTFLYEYEKKYNFYKKYSRDKKKCLYAYKSYWEYVKKYKEFIGVDMKLNLDDPLSNFRAYDNGLYELNNNQVDYLKNIEEIFGLIKHSNNFKLETRLVKRLYIYLKVFSPKWDDTYNSIIDYYIFKYRPTFFYNSFITNSPHIHYLISNNNLCYINIAPYQINKAKPFLLPIDRDTSVELFRSFSLPVPTTKIQRKIFEIVKSEFNFPYPNKKYINCLVDKLPILNLDVYNETIYYRVSNANDISEYKDFALEYDSSINVYFVSHPRLFFKDYLNYNNIHSPLNKDSVPCNVSLFLYNLTGGDINCLCNIACLVADIMTFSCIQKKLNVIFSTSEDFTHIESFVTKICDNKSIHTSYALKNMGQSKSLKELIANKANAMKAIFIDEYVERSDSNSYNKARRLIVGKKLSYMDNFFGEFNYINTLALIRITGDRNEAADYKNHFQEHINLITLSSNSTNLCFTPTDEDLNWLRVPFALFGLNLIKGRQTQSQNKKSHVKNLIDSATEFFESFCEVDPSAKVIGNELYENYLIFYNKKYNDPPLSQTLFIKNIKKYLLDRGIKHKYGQFFHTVDSNPRCFVGFTLSMTKLNKYIQSDVEREDETGYKQFYDYLLSMNSLIPDELLMHSDEIS